jgi:hypothetical protein
VIGQATCRCRVNRGVRAITAGFPLGPFAGTGIWLSESVAPWNRDASFGW